MRWSGSGLRRLPALRGGKAGWLPGRRTGRDSVPLGAVELGLGAVVVDRHGSIDIMLGNDRFDGRNWFIGRRESPLSAVF